MALPNVLTVWSHYLFNQATPITGDDLLNENLIRSKNTINNEIAGDILNINAVEFMAEGNPGNFVTGANFGFIKNFFENQNNTYEFFKKIADVNPTTVKVDKNGALHFSLTSIIILNELQSNSIGNVLDLLHSYPLDNFKVKNWTPSISQRSFAPPNEDDVSFAERVQLFETMQFQIGSANYTHFSHSLDDGIVDFVVYPDNSREIQGFVINPSNGEKPNKKDPNIFDDRDNFDFEGGNGEGWQEAGNQLNGFVTDPSNIGRKVPFNYTDLDKTPRKTYTINDFNQDKQKLIDLNYSTNSRDIMARTIDVLNGSKTLYEELHYSDVISFYDSQNRHVWYGTMEQDIIDLDNYTFPDIETKLQAIGFLSNFASEIIPKLDLPSKKGSIVEYQKYLNQITKSLDNENPKITFVGGAEDDIIKGLDKDIKTNDDRIFGGSGNDTIYGNKGEDYLEGNEGNDTLDGGEGNDLIVGGTGDDTLISSTGDDILKGGTGKDNYDFSTTTGTNHITTYGTNHVYDDDNNGIIKMSNRIVEVGEKITENVYLSTDKFFILTKVANHQLGSYDIIIKENNADIKGTVTLHNWKKDGDLGLAFGDLPKQPEGYNLIDYAEAPKNKVKGKAQANEDNLFFTSQDFPEDNTVKYPVVGGNKTDIIDFRKQLVGLHIQAGQGSDTIFGGDKSDIIWVDSYENKAQMTSYRQLFYKWTLPSHVSVDTPPLDTKLVSVLPHDENNKILGDWTDFADGGAGNDKIYGFYGRDTLYGGEGDDFLLGAGNKDEILGGDGNDIIHGDGVVVKQFAPKYWNTASNKFGYLIEREEREAFQQQNASLDWELIENHNVASGMTAHRNREELMTNLAYHDDDLLSGGKGEDIIIGEGGDDIIDGGEDNDIIMGDNISVESIYENDGIGANIEFNVVEAMNSDKYREKVKQWQAQFSGKDKLYGREGNDTIFAGSKSDYIEGNEGDDIIYADSDLLTTHIDNSLKQQTDFIHEYFKPETNKILRNQQTIFGDDKVLGGTGKDIIYGEGGNDTIDGGEDDDTLHGDANFFIHDEKNKPQHGNDKILGGLGKDTIYGGGGKDQIEAGNDDDIVYGDYSQDILDGKFHEADIIKAGLGNDKVWGQGESDIVHGEQGNDILVGDAVQSELDGQWHGNDILTGGEGEDTLYGTGGNDSLDGGDDNDYIRGDASDSQLTGNWHGNDIINGGQGDDMMSGDGGKDIIYGGEGNDEISGDEQDVNTQYHDDDTLSGGQGDDKIWGDAGNDTLNGDEGDDYLDGDAQYLDNQYHGKDNINGGQGDDIIYGRGNDDVINGGEGDDKIYADDATFQDKLGKTKGNDIVHGGLGSDIIYGGVGNDKLYGDEGNDYLIAGTGTDYLYGGEGEDGYFFYTETMQDNTTKYITDIDNLGQIILDDDNLTDNDWQIITPLSENDLKSWTDNQGNIINQTNEGYILTHEGWHSNIHILTQPSIDNILLGITLPNNRHHILNHAPTINKQLETQTVNLNDNIIINLPDDLFYDADNDNLTLTATLADGTALPTWLNFDGKTLTGTATQKQNLAIKITATDPQGEQISQTFNLQTNSRPIANNTLQTKYNIKSSQSWQLDLPKDTFTDNDDDKLSYSATLINGEPLPTGISIDSNTGQITSQSNQLGTYHINITATDPHGQTAQIQTTLNITNKLIESSQTLITGTFADDIILASNGKWHIINGLIGDDTITGGDKDDTINGGIGADTLYGLLGNDTLNGGLGNDILTGGKGNDRLEGGFGNDIYHFYKGDGQDRIFDIQGNDTLQFGQGIGAKDIWFSKKGIDLQISLLNSDDTINIEGWFIMPNQRLENFTLATGETLSGNNIDNVIKAMNYHDQNMMNDSNFTNKIELYWEV